MDGRSRQLPGFQSGVFKSEVLTAPPTRVETKFREVFRLVGFFSMNAECQVIELRPGRILGFSANGRLLDYRSQLTIEPAAGGARLTRKATASIDGF